MIDRPLWWVFAQKEWIATGILTVIVLAMAVPLGAMCDGATSASATSTVMTMAVIAEVVASSLRFRRYRLWMGDVAGTLEEAKIASRTRALIQTLIERGKAQR
jgi:hypothetical protein